LFEFYAVAKFLRASRDPSWLGCTSRPFGVQRAAPEIEPVHMPKKTSTAIAHRSTLFQALRAAARLHGSGKVILEDAERQPLTYGRLILASLVLGRRLKRETAPGEATGLLLPNVNALVIALFGLNAFGRTASLLNFTAGARNIQSAVKTGPLPVVVTSRRFIETAKLDDLVDAIKETEWSPGRRVRMLYLEDVRKEIGFLDKAIGFASSLAPALVTAGSRAEPDDTAVILFTSGTEGSPKGVALTNANLVANARQIFTHAAGFLSAHDIAMNPLPMFHSFGLTAGTLMPLLSGMKSVLYPSPLHYKQIPKLIKETKATLLLSTDTFLQGYARAADEGDTDSLRYVVAGAERVKESTREMWSGSGTEILEGYGATECSPVISCNLPDQKQHGSVGRLLPGIETRLLPVEGIAEGGRLQVRGPNVMAGYILADAPGVPIPPPGGWHDTGDIVTIEDGYIHIRGRAKRFAKIGGEMVSLAAIEALASGLWPDNTHVCVSLPFPRRGESLVLVTDKPDADKGMLADYARTQGITELWVPKALLVTQQIPILGSGKVDYAATLEMAREARPLL
jgi:acyl-[acyl-carrier-protein]-phospholipid O-acyltransferase/long-chain-fatty-acid--[acyl-carrier-protein] ligase